MRIRRPRPLLYAILVSATFLLLFASCATTGSDLFAEVAAADGAASGESEGYRLPPEGESDVRKEDNESGASLRVVSSPEGADVLLDGRRLGSTPLDAGDLAPGSYAVEVERAGYRSQRFRVDLEVDTRTVILVSLEEITGFLDVGRFDGKTEVRIDGQEREGSYFELGVGRYAVELRVFGYQDVEREVRIRSNTVTRLDPQLEPAPFTVEDFRVSRRIYNPTNPGVSGQLEFQFEVTTYGEGSIRVIDEGGRTVYERDLPRLETWDQSFAWDGRTHDGELIADGSYLVELSARVSDNLPSLLTDGLGRGSKSQGGETDPLAELLEAEPLTRTAELIVDRSARVQIRSVWSGTSGLAYAATPEVLPPGSFQIDGRVLGTVDAALGLFRFPVQASARFGMALRGLELFGQTTIGAWSDPSLTTGSVGIGAKYQVPTEAPLGLAIALRATGFSDAGSDSYTNFNGVSGSVPTSLGLGNAVRLVFTPEFVLSGEYPLYNDYPGQTAPFVWAYLRSGIVLDLGNFAAGVSAAVRTAPFAAGLAVDAPVALGLEAHWLPRNSPIYLSGHLASEARSLENFYIMGGLGLGLLY